ncbi:MAG: hypothetical protein J6Y02_02165 [Pseudobutyrivibrio sp.]|nr:hypothetical protein [Pseudobutyrivibrio sp.]
MDEFENKIYENIHYSRFVASWIRESHGTSYHKMKEWLRTLIVNGKPIPEEIIRDIYNYATNGKMELEASVRRFCSGNAFAAFGQKMET